MHEFKNVHYDYDDAGELADQIEESDVIPNEAKRILRTHLMRANRCGSRANSSAMQAYGLIRAAFDEQEADRNSVPTLSKAARLTDRAAKYRRQADMEFASALGMFLALTGRTI
jgi:hypothetical protein